MSKKDWYAILISTAGTIAGFYFKHFCGGMLAGFCICLLVFATIGQVTYRKAMRRIDRRTKDLITGADQD